MVKEMEFLRLRLEFNNSDILSSAQKSQGLEKSWLLFPQPQKNFSTVSALSAHIMHKFNLNHSCPNGLLLSMDGFALPPFVSISLLKDEDVISVQKIGYRTVEGSDTTDKVEGQQMMATNCVSTGTLLLENEEFNKESGGYETEDSDDETAKEHQENNLEVNDHLANGNDTFKKRKASQKLQGSKKKKQLSEPRETVATENIQETEYSEIPNENEVPLGKKSKSKKGKPSKNESQITGRANDKNDEKTKKDIDSASNLKINEQFQEYGEDVDGATNVPGSTKKRPSKSARRQYEKRRMLKEMKKVLDNNADSPAKKVKKLKLRQSKAEKGIGPNPLQNDGLDQPKGLLHLKKFGGKDIYKACSQPEEENQNQKTHGNSSKDIDTLNEIGPIEIRPGHVRFEALEEDQEVKRSEVSTQTYRTWMDFAKLPPLPGMPKEGDVIAYRLIGLSSSWTPEISSYRVGKVSSYNSQSCKILLMPVPEYPTVYKKLEEDESTSHQEDNIYSKDGSLEIDFTSLVDVRTVKNSDLDPSAIKGIAKHAGGVPLDKENIVTSMSLGSNEKCTESMVKGNGSHNQGNSAQAPNTQESGEDLWEKLSEALDSKKEQVSRWGKITTAPKKEELPKENGWGKMTTDSSRGTMDSNESRWGQITTSNSNNWSDNSNRNNGSYRAFGGRGPPMSYRGRGPPMSYRGRGPPMSYRGRGRTYGGNYEQWSRP